MLERYGRRMVRTTESEQNSPRVPFGPVGHPREEVQSNQEGAVNAVVPRGVGTW